MQQALSRWRSPALGDRLELSQVFQGRLVSTFLEGSIFGSCSPATAMLSAYGWILQESGPYPKMASQLTSGVSLAL